MAIYSAKNDSYEQMMRGLSVSLEIALNGSIFAKAGGDPDAPIILNPAQRGPVWENKEVRELMKTIYEGVLYNADIRKRALNATRQPDNIEIYNAGHREKHPPYLNGIKIHGVDVNEGHTRKKHDGKPYEIIDGQQRSFVLRTMCLWLLAKRASLSGELHPILLNVLMRKKEERWVPRVNFDLEENEAGSWPDGTGNRVGALNHLLAPLTDGTRADPRVLVDQIYSSIDREIKQSARFSAQSSTILRVFGAMGKMWDNFAIAEPSFSDNERLDVMAMILLQTGITVNMTSPFMNSDKLVEIDNCRGAHFTEVEMLRAVLVEKSQKDPVVAKITHRLEADAMALGNRKLTKDVMLMTYWVAMAMGTDDITSLSLFGSEGRTKEKLDDLLDGHPHPERLAKKIVRYIPAAFEAVCLAKHGRLAPGWKSQLPDDIQQTLANHASLDVRGFVAGAAWLALRAPEQARLLIPFVNLTTAGKQAVGGLLPKIKATQHGGTQVRYSYTTQLDAKVNRWTHLLKNAKIAATDGAQVMFEVLSDGNNPYANINPEDIVTLFQSIANPKERKVFKDLAIDKKKLEISAEFAPLFRSLLGLSQAQIEAGVELVEGGELICAFPGRSRSSEINTPVALKINVSTNGIARLKKTRRDIMKEFGGDFGTRAELFSERMEKARRLEGRQQDIQRLSQIQLGQWQQKGADIDSTTKGAQLRQLNSKAAALAESMRSGPQWKRLAENPNLVDIAYRQGVQNMKEKEQQVAVKAILLGARRAPNIQKQADAALKPAEVVRRRSPRRP